MKGFAMLNPDEFSMCNIVLGWEKRSREEQKSQGKEKQGAKASCKELQQKREKLTSFLFFKSFFFLILNIKLNLVMGLTGFPGPPKLLLQCLTLKYKIHYSKLLDVWTGKLMMRLSLFKSSPFSSTTEKTWYSTLSRYLERVTHIYPLICSLSSKTGRAKILRGQEFSWVCLSNLTIFSAFSRQKSAPGLQYSGKRQHQFSSETWNEMILGKNSSA